MTDSGGNLFDPGSFRDPASRVAIRGGRVERILTERGQKDWSALTASGLLEHWQGRIVRSELSDTNVLVHERIPFWTYPYEWTFAMLKRAALLHLELHQEALGRGLDLKDATPYNIQFRGREPVFVDVGSFRPYTPGDPWIGYGQFCRLFLNPLLIQAYSGIPFQPLLRGSMDGIDPGVAAAILRGQKLRPGVALDVLMQARAQRRAGTDRDVRAELTSAGFKPEMIQANLKRLHGIISKLDWKPASSAWSAYGQCRHVATQREPKTKFVEAALGTRKRDLIWDLGANDGHFSVLASRHGRLVVAADADQLVMDRLYRRLLENGPDNVLPVVVDISNPSPGLGWRNRERRPFSERGHPDVVLLLAVVHHLVVSGNLPLQEVIDWLASLDTEVVFEWVPPSDPMVEAITRNKRSGDVHDDYNEAGLRALISNHFTVQSEAPVEGRILFHLLPR